MNKIGISTLNSYRGSQIFEALGLRSKFVKKYSKLSINIQSAVKKYVEEVNNKKFPNTKFRYD